MTYSAPQPYGNPNAPVGASDRYSVLAIVGFVLAFVFSLAGLIVSIIALTQIKRTGERGRGLALAGVIISALSLIIAIVISIVVFSAAANQVGTTY
ncbi:DUF4190 domain-containing protein [Frondihabitans peucedani]|uniref:DUF4190 domain-containing protein n=1 Tax=Frondihabitans peucedani TaxID=598626 RepID=A0ABP8E1J7_9MICO